MQYTAQDALFMAARYSRMLAEGIDQKGELGFGYQLTKAQLKTAIEFSDKVRDFLDHVATCMDREQNK